MQPQPLFPKTQPPPHTSQNWGGATPTPSKPTPLPPTLPRPRPESVCSDADSPPRLGPPPPHPPKATHLQKSTPPPKKNRVEVAAHQTCEKAFFQDLLALSKDISMWQLIPEDSWTMAFRAKAWRVLSRLGGAVHQLLAHRHELFP